MSCDSDARDIENQAGLELSPVPQTNKNVRSIRDRAGQVCFLCLESPKQGQYTIPVPCLRPTKARRVVKRLLREKDKPVLTYEEANPWDKFNGCESDTDIYQRLVDTCYHHMGWQRRWVPYYGVTQVTEVNFHFAGAMQPDGRYRILMDPVKPEQVFKECEETIAMHPTIPDGSGCFKDNHSADCEHGMEYLSQPCIRVAAERAEQRRNRLLFLPLLTDCALDPATANGLHTLQGMAQESCIYDIKGPDQISLPLPYQKFQKTAPTRGLHFVLGWQIDRMRMDFPFRVANAWFGIAIVWLCVVLWRGGGGDWGTALAFAQVVAATISIAIANVRR